MIQPNIDIQNLSLTYDGEELFSHLNLSLPAGQWISLLGPSGIGKSTLLRAIAGLNMPGKMHGMIKATNHIPVSQQIAYMAQTDLLFPWLTVLENAALQLKLRHYSRHDYKIQMKKVNTLLAKVGLNKAAHLYPQQLSGGMRQRVALVRTLMEDKPIILMDEPFSALDAITRYKLQELAADLLKGKTVLFVTHDPTEALRLAHNIYIMHGYPATLKSIVQLTSATPRELTHPDVTAWQALLFHELTQAVSHT